MSQICSGKAGNGGSAAPGAVGWLSLAAAPTFAAMALWTIGAGNQQDVLCMSSHGAWLNGMAAMYALMTVFHASPWVTLIFGQRGLAFKER